MSLHKKIGSSRAERKRLQAGPPPIQLTWKWCSGASAHLARSVPLHFLYRCHVGSASLQLNHRVTAVTSSLASLASLPPFSLLPLSSLLASPSVLSSFFSLLPLSSLLSSPVLLSLLPLSLHYLLLLSSSLSSFFSCPPFSLLLPVLLSLFFLLLSSSLSFPSVLSFIFFSCPPFSLHLLSTLLSSSVPFSLFSLSPFFFLLLLSSFLSSPSILSSFFSCPPFSLLPLSYILSSPVPLSLSSPSIHSSFFFSCPFLSLFPLFTLLSSSSPVPFSLYPLFFLLLLSSFLSSPFVLSSFFFTYPPFSLLLLSSLLSSSTLPPFTFFFAYPSFHPHHPSSLSLIFPSFPLLHSPFLPRTYIRFFPLPPSSLSSSSFFSLLPFPFFSTFFPPSFCPHHYLSKIRPGVLPLKPSRVLRELRESPSREKESHLLAFHGELSR
ncbi:hypothetical protein C7M84_006335 [Penaeus vannamei]|uniref:Uncharacterized protein n=1 Tax=Penaeus vannamei TaxID=6689 RepID=A0A423TF60_PENVA|nr:hypothetical protein C7M84_006335 [Penaeus vannamei]